MQRAAGVFQGCWRGAVWGPDRVFAIGAFLVPNYVNLNRGLLLTMQQSVACFAQW
jgi:hypothetical protein